MNFEHKNAVSSIENKSEVLDDKWYDRFKEAGAFQDFEYLTGDKKYREEQKDKFLKGEIENPTLDYPELEKFDFAGKEQKLLELKRNILDNEKNEIVRQLYRWKLNEKLAQLRMLKNSKEENDRKFFKYSNFIYGKPEKEVYDYTIYQAKRIVEDKLSSNDQQIVDVAKNIKKRLIGGNESSIVLEKPSISKKDFSDEGNLFLAEEIKKAFEEAINEYQIKGWKVFVDNEGKFSSINVGQEKKEVVIPENRKMKQKELTALIAHEIKTHVLRRESGERTKLKLLGLGLDRYLKGEEGIATYEEQKIEGTNDFSGFDGHFAISLATGIDGNKRTFREVFEILRDFYFIRSKKEKNEALKLAENSAWNRCVRTFRGTTCKTQGACLTRDIVYREGNIRVWNVIKNNPEEERRFSIGKYDPSNSRHIWILDQLGITESDLEELEK